MNKTIKIIVMILLISYALLGFDIKKVNAATGYFSISSSSSVTVDNTFTVTIKATGSKIFYWQYYVSYDTTKLKLVSGSTTIQGEADDATNGTNLVTKTLKFTALKTGTAYISVARGDADMNIDTNFNSVSYTTAKKNISIVPIVAKSTNNNLASLAIDGATLTPTFDASVTNYAVEFASNTTEMNVTASAVDTKASITGAGKVALVEGVNNVNVVVTAESGATKTYTIVATVKEPNPIEVTVDNVKYSIVRKKALYQAPINFTETTIKMGNEDVLAYTNEKIGNVIGLKNETGEISLYLYDADKNKYSPYNSVTIDSINLYLKELTDKSKLPDDYERTSLTLSDKNVIAWNYDGNEKFYLIYGVNTLNGEESFYLYDKERETMQRFYDDQINDLEKQIKNDKVTIYIAFGVAAFFASASILLLVLMLLKRKGNDKSKLPLDLFLEKEHEVIKHKRKK